MCKSVRWATLLLAIVASAWLGIQAAGAQAGEFVATATIDEHDLAKATTGDPIQLYPGDSVDIVLQLTNNTGNAVSVRQVELTGQVLGLHFFSYATAVDADIQPGASQTVKYELDLVGLRGQATGLMGADIVIRDEAGTAIARIPTVTDVRGSLMSVYGLFGIALVVLTVLALIDAGLGLARNKMSANRWQRGIRLLAPGVGIGLVLTFSASVARLWAPSTGLWLVVAGLTSVVFFAIGYFSPTPDDEDDKLDEDEDLAFDDVDSEDSFADEHRL